MLPELKDGGRVADFRVPSHLAEGFVTENRAQNISKHGICTH